VLEVRKVLHFLPEPEWSGPRHAAKERINRTHQPGAQ
jgi:hypothetical protein